MVTPGDVSKSPAFAISDRIENNHKVSSSNITSTVKIDLGSSAFMKKRNSAQVSPVMAKTSRYSTA